MSIYAPDSPRAKARKSIVDFLILFPFVVAFLGMALALGTEPRMLLERTGERTFRVTGSNHFFGRQFYSKTIEGVEEVHSAHGGRNRREDSMRERNLQMRHKYLVFRAADGVRLDWDREDDWRMISDFMDGDATTLALAAPPPWWRAALTWLCLVLGGLTLRWVIKNAFFPKPSVFAR